MVVIVELRWFWHGIGKYSLKITDVKIYMHTFVKSLHSRASLWKSGNFGYCFNVTQSCNLISPLLQKKLCEHSHLGLCFFFQKWCRQKPNHFTVSNTETHPSPREKNSLPLHLDNLVLCWFWKYSRTLVTRTRKGTEKRWVSMEFEVLEF